MQDAVAVTLKTSPQVVGSLFYQAVARAGPPGRIGRQLGFVITLAFLAVKNTIGESSSSAIRMGCTHTVGVS